MRQNSKIELVNLDLINRMIKQKFFASGFLVLGFLCLSFGIAQIFVGDLSALGGWKTQFSYTTLKYFFGANAVYIGAMIWLVIGGLLVGSAVKDLRAKPNSSNVSSEGSKKLVALGRLRNRTSRRKKN